MAQFALIPLAIPEKATSLRFRRQRPKPLIDHSKPTEGRRRFYLAVAEPSLLAA
jgi:hypothetical protein